MELNINFSTKSLEANLPTTGDGVTVAVIDTGVDGSHEDLIGRVLGTGKTFITNSDYDENSQVDDYGQQGHGTFVAGIIAASANNTAGIAGVAGTANVNILPIKVMNKSGTGEAFDIVKGIDYAVEQGADVINLSLSGEYSETLEAAVEKATKQGVVVVAAAGNGGGSADASYPAALPNVISVGSITDKDQVYSGSNSGSTLDIVAPGVNILSATTKYGELGSEGGFYGTGTGTSYATPHVAAVVALYKLQNSEASAAEVQQVLESTATDLNTEGWDAKTGYGKVNAAAVLAGDIELAPLTFELPKANDNVLNTTTVQVTLTNPEQVDKTVFYVDSISTATEIGKVEGNAVTAAIEWNTTNVTDGEHAIIAVTYNASGEKLAELTRTVTVRNNPESGYMFTVKTPGNTIAKGASVRLLDKVYDEETNTYNYKELYTGTTNSEGVVRVPSNIGTDLKTLQVVVQGKFDASTEANGNTWFMYSREVSGAGSITLGSEDTVPVAMNTIDKAGKDVASAQYFIAMKDAEGIALGSTTIVNSDGATYSTDDLFR